MEAGPCKRRKGLVHMTRKKKEENALLLLGNAVRPMQGDTK
jgi:hypothetical protein